MLENDISNKGNPSEIIDDLKSVLDLCKLKFPGVTVRVVEPLGRSISAQQDRRYNQCANFLASQLNLMVGRENVIPCPQILKTATKRFFINERSGLIHLNKSGIELLSRSYQESILGKSTFRNQHIGHLRNVNNEKDHTRNYTRRNLSSMNPNFQRCNNSPRYEDTKLMEAVSNLVRLIKSS